ncbi:MAG TPA: hypothetical protein VGL81_21660 [Polyangiaceae bacterium]
MRTGVAFVVMTTCASPVYAQTSASTGPPASAKALQRAREAWDGGDFDLAPGLYQRAIDAGSLRRADVLEAYVRMGSALAVSGKTRLALTALKQAALLDPVFTVPPEAGKKAMAVAERARKAQRRVGALAVTAQVPDEVPSGASFAVEVTLAPGHSFLVDSVGLVVRDSLAARTFQQDSPPDANLHFEVPLRMTLPDATLVVHVQAVDAHNNELVSSEKRVHVARPVVAPSAALAALGPLHGERSRDRTHTSSGGFWTTAWPYIIGGAALAAGGAAVYFASRPTDDVNVGAARVELAH